MTIDKSQEVRIHDYIFPIDENIFTTKENMSNAFTHVYDYKSFVKKIYDINQRELFFIIDEKFNHLDVLKESERAYFYYTEWLDIQDCMQAKDIKAFQAYIKNDIALKFEVKEFMMSFYKEECAECKHVNLIEEETMEWIKNQIYWTRTEKFISNSSRNGMTLVEESYGERFLDLVNLIRDVNCFDQNNFIIQNKIKSNKFLYNYVDFRNTNGQKFVNDLKLQNPDFIGASKSTIILKNLNSCYDLGYTLIWKETFIEKFELFIKSYIVFIKETDDQE